MSPANRARARELALVRAAAEAMRAEILRRCGALVFPEPTDAADRLLIRMGEQTRDHLLGEIARIPIAFELPD